MVEVFPNILIGTIDDYEVIKGSDDYFTVIAAKEPYHRRAVGYSGRSCGKDNPEYLYAERSGCLICNLVDVDNPDWISDIIIDKIFADIDKALKDRRQVLICGNKGHSRSACIGMMYMKRAGYFKGIGFDGAEMLYRKIYPPYEPARGIREYARRNWDRF